MLPRLALFLCALLALPLGAMPAIAAGPAPGSWRAVLVAGDDAEPVFDNAVAAVARWLNAEGVPASDIHRLSASPAPGEAAAAAASAQNILERIASLAARPGDRCLVFITSHGEEDEGSWLRRDRRFLSPAELAPALSSGCGRVPSVVIISSCYSGAFTALRAPNRIVLTAARADRPSFGCQVGRTYTVFDGCLIDALPHAADWRIAFERSRGCVRRNERRLGALPSHPQAFFGAAVRHLPVR
jgi:peptidase C13-like protein